MKIAVLHNQNIFFDSSASANRWRTMLEGLVEHGIGIELIVTQGYQSFSEYREIKRHNQFGGVRCHYSMFMLRNNLWMRRLSRYLLSPVLARINSHNVSALLRTLSPDILFLHPSVEGFSLYDRIYSQKPNVFKLMIELNEFNDVAKSHATNRLQLRSDEKYNDLLMKRIIPETDLFLIMTKRLFCHYQDLVGKRKAAFLHLPMTVDLDRFNHDQPSALKSPYIAYVGALNNAKDGVDILIEAFSRVARMHKGLTLYLVGGYQPDVNIQKNLIDRHSLEDSIIYLGEKKRDEIPPILMGADLLVLPRPDSRQAQGGFPTKLGEYLATGNPVCATKVGEIPDYLTDNVNVYFALPGDVDSFADAMSRALADKTKARRIGMNGRGVAEEQFNMDIQARTLIEFLKSNVEG